MDRGWTIEDMRKHPLHEILVASTILNRVDILANPPPDDEKSVHEMLKSNPDLAASIAAYYREKEKLYGGPIERPPTIGEEEP